MADERAEAVHAAAEAFDLTNEYSVRVMATVREEVYSNTHTGVDVDDIVRQLREIHFKYEYDAVEGDEIAFIIEENELGTADDEVEADLRWQGEPYSWDACILVKEMAALKEDELTLGKLVELVQRAKGMCLTDRDKDHESQG